MEQEKNKVPSQDNENPGSEKFQRAQELYERYFISNAEADFEEMITVLDSIYKNKVRTELWKKGCHDEENYQDAMQEARQGIWTQIKKQRKTGEVRKDFSQYCGGIYTHKAVDIAKKKNSYEQKLREVKRKGKKGKEVTMYKIGRFTFDTQKQVLAIDDKSTKLTTKESELLSLLCAHVNEILERNFALKTIWIDDNYFNARSMDVYITKLRKHLKDDPSIEIINIHGKGYKLIAPDVEAKTK